MKKHLKNQNKLIQRDLEMWHAAKAYYEEMGWEHLSQAAEKQIQRIVEKKARLVIGRRLDSSPDPNDPDNETDPH